MYFFSFFFHYTDFSIMNNGATVHNHIHRTIREQEEADHLKSSVKRRKLHENVMTQQQQDQLKYFVDRPNNNTLNLTL